MPEHRREASTERPQSQPRPRPHSPSPSDVSMRDLLASCAAAHAVSTPPEQISAVAVAEERAAADERATRRDAA
jgi:hypothetical protein